MWRASGGRPAGRRRVRTLAGVSTGAGARLGLITDLHFREAVAGDSKNPKREGRRIGELLPRCLEELRNAGVELLLCAGDCVDDETLPGVMEDLAALRAMLERSGVPFVVVPGNHDPRAEDFYRVFRRPERWYRVGGCDVVVFGDDEPVPGKEQARRPEGVLGEVEQRLREPGPLTFALQHYVVFPDHEGPGYNHTYENAAEVRGQLERSPRKIVSLSGHYHRGHALHEHNGVRYLTARSLCERPYPFCVIDGDAESGEVRIEERTLGDGGG